MALSIWAPVAAVVTSMVLGMLWYGPLFGKRWVHAMGWGDLTEEQLKEKQSQAGPGYALSVLTVAGSTVLLNLLFDWSVGVAQVGDIAWGALLGLLGWLAFYVPGTATSSFFEGRSITLVVLNLAYFGVQSVLIGVWVGVFA